MTFTKTVAAAGASSSSSSSSAADILPAGYSVASPQFNHGALALELAHAGFGHEAHASFRAAAEFEGGVQVGSCRLLYTVEIAAEPGWCLWHSHRGLRFPACIAEAHTMNTVQPCSPPSLAEPHELWRL